MKTITETKTIIIQSIHMYKICVSFILDLAASSHFSLPGQWRHHASKADSINHPELASHWCFNWPGSVSNTLSSPSRSDQSTGPRPSSSSSQLRFKVCFCNRCRPRLKPLAWQLNEWTDPLRHLAAGDSVGRSDLRDNTEIFQCWYPLSFNKCSSTHLFVCLTPEAVGCVGIR